MGEMTIQGTDRYDALGIPHPDPATMCHGPCEGIGFYPDMDGFAAGVYADINAVAFVTCGDCGGTGLAT